MSKVTPILVTVGLTMVSVLLALKVKEYMDKNKVSAPLMSAQ